MTMTRRIALLIAAVLLPALLGSLWIHTLAARDALQLQLEVRNQDAATALALTMSQQDADLAAMQTVVNAQFDLGHYRRLAFVRRDASLVFERVQPLRPAAAPAWFVAALPIQSPPGQAAVSDGWRELGLIQVESQAAWAHAALWAACSRTALLLALLAAAAAAAATWLLRGWQRPLLATVAQARAIEDGHFVMAPEPALPELRTLTRSMNAMSRRLNEVFDAQAGQVALLQRQAQADPVTGLPMRRQFVGRLADRLADAAAPSTAVLLVRLLRLEAVNERLGFEATDRLLAATAEVLQTYVDRVPGALAGRLNGSDFGLVLPVAGVAAETAQSLAAALAASPLAREGAARYCVGGVDGLRLLSAGAALAAADAALARAEVAEAPVVEVANGRSAEGVGARAWRAQIVAALDAGRTRLAEFPVVDREGVLIHLECPLRVQLVEAVADAKALAVVGTETGTGTGTESRAASQGQAVAGGHPAEFRPASDWLALAVRGRLMPRVDLAALQLALAAIARDGLPRCVHVAQTSLLEPGFVGQVQQRLSEAPLAARQLYIEWVERAQPAAASTLREAAAAWRALGVRVGVEHAGASPQALTQWHGTRIDYVKIDARHLQGVADDTAVHGYASRLVALVQGMGLKAVAEGITDARDLTALFALGFDGATGAAVVWKSAAVKHFSKDFGKDASSN